MSYTPVILAVACVAIGLLSWLTASVRDIIRHKEDFNRADSQLTLYRLLRTKAPDGPEEARLQEKVEMSKMICKNTAAEYNRCLAKPRNFIPAMILGYSAIGEEEKEE